MKKIYLLLTMVMLWVVASPPARAGVAETTYCSYGAGTDHEWNVRTAPTVNVVYDYFTNTSDVKAFTANTSSGLNYKKVNNKYYLRFYCSYTQQLFIYVDGSQYEHGAKMRIKGYLGDYTSWLSNFGIKVSKATYNETDNKFTVGTTVTNPLRSGYWYEGNVKGEKCGLSDPVDIKIDCGKEPGWYCIDAKNLMVENIDLIKCIDGHDVKLNLLDPQNAPVTDATASLTDGETTYQFVNAGDGSYTFSLDPAIAEGKTYTASAYNLMYKGTSDPFTVSGNTDVTLKFQDENAYTLTLNVIDQKNVVLDDATLSLTDGENPVELTPAGNGVYTAVLKYSQIAGKTFTVSATRPGCNPVTESFTMEGDKNVTVTINRTYFTLDVYNTHPAGTSTITKATVTDPDAKEYTLTVDAADKSHASISVPAEYVEGKEFTLTVKPFYAPTMTEVFVWEGDKIFNLECDDHFTLTVKPIYRDTNEPITDCVLYCQKGASSVYNPETSIIMPQTSPGVYQYRVPTAQRGQWSYGIYVRYCNHISGSVFLDDDKESPAPKMYYLTPSYEITLTDNDGNPVTGASVQVFNPNLNKTETLAEASNTGVYKKSLNAYDWRAYKFLIDSKYYVTKPDDVFEYNNETQTHYEYATTGHKYTYVLDDRYYNLDVKVVDEEGNTVEGATVTMGETVITPDEAGAYTVALKAIDYDGKEITLSAAAEGYTAGQTTVTVDGDKSVTVTLQDADPTYKVTFKMVDEDHNVIPAHILRATTDCHVWNFQYYIDGKRFSIDEPDNEYSVFTTTMKASEIEGKELKYYASHHSSLYKDREDTFEVNGSCEIEIVMEAVMFSMTWTITDEDNNPVTGLEIPVKNTTLDEWEATGFVETEPGVYYFARRGADCLFDSYEADAHKEYMNTIGQTWRFFRSKEMSYSSKLYYDKYQLAITVTAADSEDVIENATVTVTPDGGEAIEVPAYTIAGRYVAKLRAIDYDGTDFALNVEAPHYVGASETFVLDDNKWFSFALEPKMHSYTVNVVDEDGNALHTATVKVTDHNGDNVAIDNNGDGSFGFSIHSLKAQGVTYTTVVTHEGYTAPEAYTFNLEDGHVSHTLTLTKIDTGIDAVRISENVAVKGGHIYVTGDAVICDILGRVVRVYRDAAPDTEVDALAPGVYIVNGLKVVAGI